MPKNFMFMVMRNYFRSQKRPVIANYVQLVPNYIILDQNVDKKVITKETALIDMIS